MKETAGGSEPELIRRPEAVIQRQLREIYEIFVMLGSPEFVIRRIVAVHATYFESVQIIAEMIGPGSASIKYVGFTKQHRIIGL